MRVCAVNLPELADAQSRAHGAEPARELARIAEVALAFGATVSFHQAPPAPPARAASSGDVAVGPRKRGTLAKRAREPRDAFGDVVWVDVTGCAHLFAPAQAEGEARLAARLAGAVRAMGHACSIALADGPRVAAILARAGGASGPLVVAPGKNREALTALPLHALPLSPDDVRWLTKVGVRTVGELRELPRGALAARLGERAREVLSLADGEDRAPLTPYTPPEIPEEEATLEYGVESTEALVFIAKTLSDRLGVRLAGRAAAASRLELDLSLDAAMLSEGQEPTERVASDLPAPLSASSDLLAALRPKIERLALRSPVLRVALRAPALVRKPEAALSLFEPQPKAERALPRLVAELAADLGEAAVGKLALGDAWSPEARSRFVVGRAFADREKTKAARHLLSSVPEPTRLLDEPWPVPRDRVRVVRHLARLEHVEWWKRLGDGAIGGASCDYVYAWVDDAAAWVEIDRATGAARVRGWFD